MNLFELVARLTLDSSKYEQGIKSSESTAVKFGKKLDKGLATAAKVGAAAIGAASTAVVAFGKSAVEASMNFETSFAQLNTIMDTTQKSVESMQDGLMQLSNKMGISASELAETTYNAISATGDTAGALTIVENASKLAVAGFTDTASALSTLTTVMNSYKMESGETINIADSLIAVQNLGVTTVSELSASMGKAIATASAYGVDLYNLESAYISLTKSGINTAESTTYIASMMKELGSESSKVSKVIKDKTGKSFDQLMKEGKSVGDVLGILSDSVKGDSAALINLWGSAEAGKAANAIASQGLEEFNNNLLTVQKSAGATETAFGTMQQTLSAKINKLSTNFENLKIAVGSDTSSIVSVIVGSATDAVEKITNAYKTDGLTGAIDAFGESLGDIAVKIVDYAPQIVEAAISLIKSFGKAISDNADTVINAAFEILTDIANELKDPEGLLKIIDAGLDIIIKLADGLSENLPTLLPAVVDIIMTIAEKLTEPDMLEELVTSALDLILALADGLINAQNRLLEKAPVIVMNLMQAIMKAAPKLVSAAVQLILTLVRGLVEQFGMIIKAGVDIVNKVKEGFQKQKDDAKNWGKELLDGFVKGIKEKWEQLKSSVQGVVNGIKSIFTGKQGFDEHSPSKWGKKVFDNLMLGAEEGLEQGAPSLLKQTQNVVKDVQDEFDNEYNPTVGGGSGSLAQILSLLRQYLPQLSDMDVTLDTGALVGGLAPGMDAALGQRMGYVKRGVTA